jgi:molybdopterin-synthase adenylyltransferase
LTNEKLAAEAGLYGSAGSRPQVVWPNGVLASTAVGLAVEIVTGWTRRSISHIYLVYDGNQHTINESITLTNLKIKTCPHFLDSDVGDPMLVDL